MYCDSFTNICVHDSMYVNMYVCMPCTMYVLSRRTVCMARIGRGEHAGQEICECVGEAPEERGNKTGMPAEGELVELLDGMEASLTF